MSDIEARAAHAERLMNDELLTEALDAIDQSAIDTWKSTGALQEREREIAWLTIKVAGRVRSELQSIINDGKIAAARIQAPLR